MKQLSDEQIINLREPKEDNDIREEKKPYSVIESNNKEDEGGDVEEIISEDDDSIEWQAEEHGHFPKTKVWFFVLAIFATLIEIYLLWTKSFFSSATFLLIFFVVFLYSARKPRILKFKIDFRGIEIESGVYKFDEFESFWIFYEPPAVKELFLRNKKTVGLSITIPVGDNDPVVLREFLKRYLPEVEEEESIIDVLARRIGF